VRKATFAAVLAMVAVGALALAGAGSAAQTKSGGLATLRAANTQVAATVVRQVGLRNYAGPNCPGRGWNCTTSTSVRQIATAGGTNVGVCSGGSVVVTGPSQACSITQSGSTNTARCTEQSSTAGAALSCTITQTGAANYAYVNQNINQSAGSNQVGTETANVTQSGATVTNYLQLSQAANQSTKTGSSQNQNADQSANIEQTATGAGTNYSTLNQTQLQKAYGSVANQTQNGTSNLPDCNPYSVETPGPDNPNACAVVLQHSGAGKNTNQLRQNIGEDENSSIQANQLQGAFDGGLDGRVHQDTVSGTSLNVVNQSKLQHETAASGSSQTQDDPISCCGFASQVGGTGDKETINQTSALSASGDSSPEQFVSLIGTSHTPVGTCTITQKGSVNGASATNTDTLTPTCPFLTLETTCSNGNTDLDAPGSGSCTPSPPNTSSPTPPLSSLSKQVSNNNDTYGTDTTVDTGGTLSYQINYSNSSNALGTAHNVVVSDPIPSGTSYVAGSCSPACTVSGGTISWNLGDVSPDGGTNVFFQVTVNATSGTITNTASGTDDDEAPFSSNPTTATVNPIIP
jgi:uncharacterized repeat protein (TIGR01451 family)